MIKPVFAYYDIVTGIYDSPMVFDSVKIAINAVRRNTRDMFINKKVTLDSLRENQLRMTAYYDTGFGTFRNIEECKNDKDCDFEFANPILLSAFVSDLVESAVYDYEIPY